MNKNNIFPENDNTNTHYRPGANSKMLQTQKYIQQDFFSTHND